MRKIPKTLTVRHSWRSDEETCSYTPGSIVLSIATRDGDGHTVLKFGNVDNAKQLIWAIEHGLRDMLVARRTAAAKKAWVTRRQRAAAKPVPHLAPQLKLVS